MLLVQKWPFFELLFLGNTGQKNVFYNILEWKNAFLGYKNKKFKMSNNRYFSHFFFLGNVDQKNVFYDILERQNALLGYKNEKSKKSKNWHFSKGVDPWFCSKNGHFSNFCFLGNIGQENVFYDILEQKEAFLGYKNKKLKKSKNGHFSIGVRPWFWSKNGHFSNFFFWAIYARKMSFTIFYSEKTPF